MRRDPSSGDPPLTPLAATPESSRPFPPRRTDPVNEGTTMATDKSRTVGPSGDRRAPEGRLADFARSWHDGRLAECARELPPAGNPARLPALVALVKADLAARWQRGQQVLVERYLTAYPELGSAETAPADLVVAEYDARRAAGAAPDLADFTLRFPRQAQELR